MLKGINVGKLILGLIVCFSWTHEAFSKSILICKIDHVVNVDSEKVKSELKESKDKKGKPVVENLTISGFDTPHPIVKDTGAFISETKLKRVGDLSREAERRWYIADNNISGQNMIQLIRHNAKNATWKVLVYRFFSISEKGIDPSNFGTVGYIQFGSCN